MHLTIWPAAAINYLNNSNYIRGLCLLESLSADLRENSLRYALDHEIALLNMTFRFAGGNPGVGNAVV